MKSSFFLVPTFSLALFMMAGSAHAQVYGRPSFGYERHQAEEAWERRGFSDGVVGAEHDFGNHRRPDVNNRDEYRNPRSVPGWARHEYREGFRRGYDLGVRQNYYGYRRGDYDDYPDR